MSNVKSYTATLVEKRERRIKVYATSVEDAINRLAELYNNNTIHTDVLDVVDSDFINFEEIKEERCDI